MPSLVLIGIWRYFGVNSLYFLSGLQGIPQELGEASRIDGANGVQEFWHVTMPLLKPISVYIIFTAINGSFSLFGEIYTLIPMDSSGTRDSMLFPVVYLYRSMFRDNRLNYAATNILYAFLLSPFVLRALSTTSSLTLTLIIL